MHVVSWCIYECEKKMVAKKIGWQGVYSYKKRCCTLYILQKNMSNETLCIMCVWALNKDYSLCRMFIWIFCKSSLYQDVINSNILAGALINGYCAYYKISLNVADDGFRCALLAAYLMLTTIVAFCYHHWVIKLIIATFFFLLLEMLACCEMRFRNSALICLLIHPSIGHLHVSLNISQSSFA